MGKFDPLLVINSSSASAVKIGWNAGMGRLRPLVLLATGVLLSVGDGAHAYNQYSVNKDLTNCAACHGDYRDSPYISLTDGASWGTDLMSVHATNMLSNDCNTCHGAGPFFPVAMNISDGGNGLAAISCVGCHGRAQDRGVFPDDCVGSQAPAPPGCVADPSQCPAPGAGEVCGDGAGLRQHHFVVNRTINTSGGPVSTQVCVDCHLDSDPTNFTTAGEEVLPPYYSASDPNHPNIPSDPCNPIGDGFPEDYAGSFLGLDNNGNDIYDENDVVFCPEPGETSLLASGISLLLVLRRRRNLRESEAL
jgi:hypothetical protein